MTKDATSMGEMSKGEMAGLAQRQLDAYNKGDIEAFCACFHQEVKVVRLTANTTGTEGMAAYKARYQALFAANPELKAELKSRIVLDKTVLDEEWVTGIVERPEGVHAVAIYGFRDGLIDRIWFP